MENTLLTVEEINKLKKFRNFGITSGIVTFVLLTSCNCFFYFGEYTSFEIALITQLIGFAVPVFFYYHLGAKYAKDISGKTKNLKKQKLRRKLIRKDKHGGIAYFFHIADKKQEVDKTLFDSASAGDLMIMHYTPYSHHLLKIELSKETE